MVQKKKANPRGTRASPSLTFRLTHASEAGERTCRSVENKRSTETAPGYKYHAVSDDYRHKERKRRRKRGLKRKVSAHSSEERDGGMDRRGETNAEQTSDDISQEGTPESRQHVIMEHILSTHLLYTQYSF